MNKKFNQYSDEIRFWEACIQHVNQQINPPNKGEAKRVFHLAASGGSSAQILSQLKQKNFDFSNVDIWQVDERYVPKDHPDSNYQLLHQIIGNNAKKIQAFDPTLPIEKAVKTYEKHLIKSFQTRTSPHWFDLTILGVGSDGHIASLFPNKNSDKEPLDSTSLAIHTQTDQLAIKDRLTLSYATIKRSKKIMVILIGSQKNLIWQQIQNPTTSEILPVHVLKEWEQVTFWWLNNK